MAKKKTFESTLTQLEEIVRELESGTLTLEESIKKFETGMACSKFCLQTLDKTEKKITLLMKDSQGDLVEEPFDHES